MTRNDMWNGMGLSSFECSANDFLMPFEMFTLTI